MVKPHLLQAIDLLIERKNIDIKLLNISTPHYGETDITIEVMYSNKRFSVKFFMNTSDVALSSPVDEYLPEIPEGLAGDNLLVLRFAWILWCVYRFTIGSCNLLTTTGQARILSVYILPPLL